jgi:AraC-like DNA-binding protein
MSLGGALRVIVSELASVGLDPTAVCAEVCVDPRSAEEGGAPLGLPELTQVLARAEAITGDSLLGLHMAERAQGRGVLSYLTRAQRTVGAGLEAFERFAEKAWGGRAPVRVHHGPLRARVSFHLDAGLSRHGVEYVVARAAISLRRSGASPREVCFRHPPGGALREYERVFRCPVRFRQPETGFSLRRAELARPLRTASPEAAKALASALAHAPAGDGPPPLSARLAAAVEDAIARGVSADRETLARALGMSGKTLSRRLAAEQRRFRDVVDEVRRTLARRLVAEPALDLGEIATRLAFADLASFGKAFRRWFGTPPSAYRARAAAGRVPPEGAISANSSAASSPGGGVRGKLLEAKCRPPENPR